VEDGGISTVVDGGITELDPAGDRLLVDISGFADEWLHPLSRPKSRRVNRKVRAIAARDSPLWHASFSEDRPISGAYVRFAPESGQTAESVRHVRLVPIPEMTKLIQSPRRRGQAASAARRGRSPSPP
jgi:hypothetical protein